MAIIIIGIIIIYLLVIIWTWTSLEDIEKKSKILIALVGIVAIFLVTQIVFSISKNGIAYGNKEIEKSISVVIMLLFTGINSLLLPFLGRNIKRRANGEIDDNILKSRIIIILVIFLMCLFLECGYMKDIQEGILNIYKSNIK